MPAITLGLAEIEERLRMLRRRLNAVVIQHGVYVSGSVVVLVAAALVVLALQGSVATFRIAAWAGAAVSLGVIAGSVVFLQRRWLDPQATAHLVDRRAQLTDRLATVVSLRTRPQSSRLTPMLIAQALGMGRRWQIQEIAPRRVPYSVFALLASILVLGLTPFTAPHRPASGSPGGAAETSAQSLVMPAGHQPNSAGVDGAPAGGAAAGGAVLQPSSDPGTTAASSGTAANGTAANLTGDADTSRADGAQAGLPDRLQSAIRHAFGAEVMDKPRALADGDKGTDGSDDRMQGTEAAKQHPQTSGAGKPMSRNGTAPEASGRDPRNASGQSSRLGERDGQQRDPKAPSGDFNGSSPAAGDGSSPGNLMSPPVAGAALGGDGPKTFKITLTSFLRATELQGHQPRASQEPGGTSAGAGAIGSSPTALSDRQLSDDALRKAEIPAEYEDIVRRVYSVRGQ